MRTTTGEGERKNGITRMSSWVRASPIAVEAAGVKVLTGRVWVRNSIVLVLGKEDRGQQIRQGSGLHRESEGDTAVPLPR
eukprot:2434777-Rhodomonas_salina.2